MFLKRGKKMKKKVVLLVICAMAMSLLSSCKNANSKAEQKDYTKYEVNVQVIEDQDFEFDRKYQDIRYVKIEVEGNEMLEKTILMINTDSEQRALSFKEENKSLARGYDLDGDSENGANINDEGIDNKDYDDSKENTNESVEESEDDGVKITYYEDINITRQDSKYLSFKKRTDTYTMGAHGNYFIEGYILAVEDGASKKIYDIINNREDFKKYIYDWCERNKDKYGFFDEYKETVDMYMSGELELQCYFNNDDLYVIFQIYDIAPYAAGPFEVKIDKSLYADDIQ